MLRPLSFVARCLSLILATSACSPSTVDGVGAVIPGRVPNRAGAGGTESEAFAELPGGSVGPYLARGREEVLAVWAEPDADGALEWVSLRLDTAGRAFGSPRRLGAAPPNLGIVRVRPAGDATWVVGVGELDGRHRASAFRLSAAGARTAAGADWTTQGGAVVWTDVVPTRDGGALIFWAERVAETAQVFVQALNAESEPVTPPRLIYEAARAWQVVSVADGALLGVVSRAGAVDLVPVANDGSPSAVARLPGTLHAEGEIDLMPIQPSRILVAFSEERWLESRIFSVFVNERGTPLGELTPAVPERGPQVLRQLVGNASAPYLAWQDTREEPSKLRVTRLSSMGTSAGTIVDVPMDPGAFPELAASEIRLAAVVAACQGERCPKASSLVEFDRSLTELVRTPLMIAGRPVNLSWDLGCVGSSCTAMGAVFSDRSPVALLGSLAQQEDAPPTPWTAEDKVSIAALVPAPELASLAVQGDAQGTTVAWLSYFDPSIPYERPKTIAPDGRLAPVQAELRTQFVPAGVSSAEFASKLPTSETISIRARSVAGIALARKADRQLLAWSAIDGEAPQVFMTELDARGHRLRQGMLTRQKGEILTVRAAATNNGWVIAWIDDRRGRPEAYVSLVGPSLERLTPDTRLELNMASLSGLDLTFVNGEIWLAASDLKAASPGLYVARYEPRALQLIAPPTRIEPNRESLRNPRWAVSDGTLAVVWLEGGAGGSLFRRADLTPDGKVRSVTAWTRAGDEPDAFELACDATCNVIFGARDSEGIRLFSLEAALGAASEARPLARLVSPKALGVGAASAAGAVYYFDVNADGGGAVHRVQQQAN